MRPTRTPARSHRVRCLLAATLLAALASPEAGADDPTAREPWPEDASARNLLTRTYRNLYEGDFVQVMRLTSRSGTGRSVTRRLQIVRKQSEPPGRAIVRFLAPPDIRGTSLLVIERDARHDDVFLYLPAFDRTKRITAAQRYDAFFGTNLTYEDLEPKQPADFEARTEGRGEVAGTPCLRLRVRPRPGVESQYDYTLTCIDPERAVPLSIEFWAGERKLKTLVSDPSKVRHENGRFVPTLVTVASHASPFVTEIFTEGQRFHAEIPDRLFTTWNLESGSDDDDLKLLRSSPEEQP